MSLVPWRATCRALAEARAREEAQLLWESGPQRPAPFEHRWEHVQHVVALALRLAEALGADREVVEAAAWLHDIRKMEPRHALAGAAEAISFLPTTDFPPTKIAAAVDAIAQHEGFYRPAGAPPIKPLEAAVLWDADKLSKLGVQYLAHSLSTPYVRGKTMVERRHYVARFAHDVLARTVESMNTEPARTLARRRYDDMLRALEAWAREEQEEAFPGDRAEGERNRGQGEQPV